MKKHTSYSVTCLLLLLACNNAIAAQKRSWLERNSTFLTVFGGITAGTCGLGAITALGATIYGYAKGKGQAHLYYSYESSLLTASQELKEIVRLYKKELHFLQQATVINDCTAILDGFVREKNTLLEEYHQQLFDDITTLEKQHHLLEKYCTEWHGVQTYQELAREAHDLLHKEATIITQLKGLADIFMCQKRDLYSRELKRQSAQKEELLYKQFAQAMHVCTTQESSDSSQLLSSLIPLILSSSADKTYPYLAYVKTLEEELAEAKLICANLDELGQEHHKLSTLVGTLQTVHQAIAVSDQLAQDKARHEHDVIQKLHADAKMKKALALEKQAQEMHKNNMLKQAEIDELRRKNELATQALMLEAVQQPIKEENLQLKHENSSLKNRIAHLKNEIAALKKHIAQLQQTSLNTTDYHPCDTNDLLSKIAYIKQLISDLEAAYNSMPGNPTALDYDWATYLAKVKQLIARLSHAV